MVQKIEGAVDKSVYNPADKPVHNLVEKPVGNTTDGPKVWYEVLADQLVNWHGLSNQLDKDQIKQIIISLGQALTQGDTCIQLASLNVPLSHPLIVDESLALQQPAPLVRAGDYVYFFRQWQQEYQLAAQIMRLLQPVRSVLVQFDPADQTNVQQQQAIQLAAQHPFCLITGGPGTGKTYTLVRIVKALREAEPALRIALAAPTGKAAQRMQEVLIKAFEQQQVDHQTIQPAQTLHRLLGLGGRGQPKYNAKQSLPFDLIVLDEGSMLDLELASQLFAAIAVGTRLIILGDADQLAAVEAGAVLADLQQTPALKAYQVHLEESRRFAADQGIGQLAHAILQQDEAQLWQAFDNPLNQHQLHYTAHVNVDKHFYDQLWQGYSAYVDELKRQQQTGQYDVAQLFNSFDQYRILTAMRFGGMGTERINQEMSVRLQQVLTQGYQQMAWFHGRPVMMSRNDYGLKLSNGDIGICLQVHDQWQVYFPHLSEPIAVTRLPMADISTAFAMTIHKSQGSEFNHVAVLLDAAATSLLSRELLYTAVTRAKLRVSLKGTREVVVQSLQQRALRKTGLVRQFEQLLKIVN